MKPLVFVLDNIPDETVKKEKKDKKRKKDKKTELTNRNFGSFLDIGKVKNAKTMSLAWRCRLLGYTTGEKIDGFKITNTNSSDSYPV